MKRLVCVLLFFLLPAMSWAQCYKCPKCGKYHCRLAATAEAGEKVDAATEVVKLVNVERKRRGLHLLQYHPHLGAQQHARNQHARRSMYHAGGYAENVAVGQRSPQSVVRTWMNSSGHRANILGRRYTFIDVGRSGNYWAQRFK